MDDDPLRLPNLLITVTTESNESPPVEIWFTANRVLLMFVLFTMTRVSSAPANDSAFFAIASHSSRDR